MDLLVMKSGSMYIRVKEDTYQPCDLAKASVFSMAQLATVKKHLDRLQTMGCKEIHLKRLVVTEEDVDVNPS